ncbi:MAG: hypothetical protein NTW50_00395 [Candidatus Berkelbacteria bacterium]|nr:hypothetical protein [Candidatus Berkelbacteria bacterium]
MAARLPELTQKLAEIDGKLVNLTNAEVEKASLETTIQKLENGLLKDADMLKDVKECMLKAAKDRLEKSVGKLASQGSKYGGEDQIGLGEYAKLQADYSLWSGSKYFGEISTDPEAKALSDELINVLNTAITNEVKAVDPSNVGRSIDKTWQTIESALPKDEAKSKEALKLIRSTLTDRLNTETDRPKQLFLNRVLAKIKNNY